MNNSEKSSGKIRRESLRAHKIWRSTQVVVRAPSRKRLGSQGPREFESHLLRWMENLNIGIQTLEPEKYTPDDASKWLLHLGYNEQSWDAVVEQRKASHTVRALIRIARGDEARHFVDVYNQVRAEEGCSIYTIGINNKEAK